MDIECKYFWEELKETFNWEFVPKYTPKQSKHNGIKKIVKPKKNKNYVCK